MYIKNVNNIIKACIRIHKKTLSPKSLNCTSPAKYFESVYEIHVKTLTNGDRTLCAARIETLYKMLKVIHQFCNAHFYCAYLITNSS